jgi:uncharacterized OB-fold protein
VLGQVGHRPTLRQARQRNLPFVTDGATTETGELPPRILTPLTPENRPFWTGGERGELLILRCASCRRWAHPPAAHCADCGGVLTAEAVSGRGTVFTFTINHQPYNPAIPVPYAIAIVELAEQEGLRFTTNIVNTELDAIEIGMPVRVAFEQQGEVFVPVFEPATNEPQVR